MQLDLGRGRQEKVIIRHRGRDDVLLEVVTPNLSLRGLDAPGILLEEADLDLQDLTNAKLPGAVLDHCSLKLAHMPLADLTSAKLRGADLSGAVLCRAKLNDASLIEAQLGCANLWMAECRRALFLAARLVGTNFTEADLRGASLEDADVRDACFRGSYVDENTVWPTGFAPESWDLRWREPDWLRGEGAASIKPAPETDWELIGPRVRSEMNCPRCGACLVTATYYVPRKGYLVRLECAAMHLATPACDYRRIPEQGG